MKMEFEELHDLGVKRLMEGLSVKSWLTRADARRKLRQAGCARRKEVKVARALHSVEVGWKGQSSPYRIGVIRSGEHLIFVCSPQLYWLRNCCQPVRKREAKRRRCQY